MIKMKKKTKTKKYNQWSTIHDTGNQMPRIHPTNSRVRSVKADNLVKVHIKGICTNIMVFVLLSDVAVDYTDIKDDIPTPKVYI